jgi:hypothetical protein
VAGSLIADAGKGFAVLVTGFAAVRISDARFGHQIAFATTIGEDFCSPPLAVDCENAANLLSLELHAAVFLKSFVKTKVYVCIRKHLAEDLFVDVRLGAPVRGLVQVGWGYCLRCERRWNCHIRQHASGADRHDQHRWAGRSESHCLGRWIRNGSKSPDGQFGDTGLALRLDDRQREREQRRGHPEPRHADGDPQRLTGNSTPGNQGGAIDNTGTLMVSNSTFSGNSSSLNGSGFGGAIDNTGTLAVGNSTFNGNASGNIGGALSNAGTLAVSGSTFVGNSSANGGGIALDDSGTATIENRIFSQNTSRANGAAIFGSGSVLDASNNVFFSNLEGSSESDCFGCTTN